MKKLWGDNFYHPGTNKWSHIPSEGTIRGFCYFILDPIYKMFNAVLSKTKEGITQLNKLLKQNNIIINEDEAKLEKKPLLQVRILNFYIFRPYYMNFYYK